jgi:acyl-CoA hydrolase
VPERFVRESASEYTEIVLPNFANPFGVLLGGRVMHLVDIVGATAAMRHCRTPVSTAAVDQMVFFNPVQIGELIILKASVNRAFNTSMEVGVKVLSENLYTGEVKHTSSAYLTFVSQDKDRNPVKVHPITPETPDEIRRFEQALHRREQRLKHRPKR